MFGILRVRITVVPNGKNPPKMRFKKIVKLAVHSYACNDLTNFESKVYANTGNGNAVNLSESIIVVSNC